MATDDSNNRNNENADAENVHRRTQQQVANDGSNAPRPENVGGVSVQQQGINPLTSSPDSFGDHGGNRSGNNETPQGAKGSSNRGDQPSADQRNQGGGQDNEKANQTKNTTEYKDEYSNGSSAPSPANDGGTIDDENNS